MIAPSSYSACATRIVWLAENPSLRAASCCSVDVVNGAGGLRVSGLVSTVSTVKRPASTAALAAAASPPVPIDSRSSFSPFHRTSRLLNATPSCSNTAVTDQYSCGRNASISRSRLTTSRSATDCTRPADFAPGSFRHRTGDSVNPTR